MRFYLMLSSVCLILSSFDLVCRCSANDEEVVAPGTHLPLLAQVFVVYNKGHRSRFPVTSPYDGDNSPGKSSQQQPLNFGRQQQQQIGGGPSLGASQSEWNPARQYKPSWYLGKRSVPHTLLSRQ
ncbi:hypothetical protein BV898_11539 [Hypsibius exemplaris]|uniref:Secreted protein n=1 Tax=Hypsibius exemplaris TaxID=2072580 RepID=A0A1W0WGH6_HYPEX|nr:hypothetical protein BV898_11539 [Hypsibius exemplaris]